MKKIYFYLWIFCIIGSWAILPYLYALGLSDSFWKLFLFATLQSAIVFGLVCWLSSIIVPKTDLTPFENKNFPKKILMPSLIAGILLGLVIFFSDKYIFDSSSLSGMHPSPFLGALASIYGAVNEEVLLRLFLFSLIYFVLKKLFKGSGSRNGFLWSANILVALLFGLGHMPAAFKIASITPLEIFRILFLNGIAGLVFGYLYWTRGLWTAMVAHFITDLMIHVFLV